MRTTVKVCVPGYGHYWLWLVTYDTREALKRAAEKHAGCALDDMTTDDETGIEGCFSDTVPFRGPYLGIMRLYNLSTACIIHESVHAAMCMAKKVHGKSNTMSHTKEEAVAYGTEAIALAVHEALFPGSTSNQESNDRQD